MNLRQRKRLILWLKFIPLVLLAIGGLVAASQLTVVREFLAGATGEPANIQIDTKADLGPLPRPWQNIAQGGEMSDWRIAPIKAKVQALQFRYIRLDHIYSFYDIVKKDGGQLRYDFSKLDPLIDDILSVGAKPYIALSYMPATISSDGQITSPPANWGEYQDVIRATIQHYSGEKKIANVVYEVWNEPDLFGGWKPYGNRNYLTLYNYAARGQAQVKNAQPYLFGGPAITALYETWFTKLVEFAHSNNLRLDFFSWHRYNLDIEVFRKDMDLAKQWRAKYPYASNMQLHITEYGPDSEVNPGYDTSMSAAHTAAVGIESVGNLDLGFPFEIEDGKDPKGQERWGRWGVLTNHEFGANIKPRYLGMRLMNRIGGNQIRLLGKGTWVKALATKNGDNYEMLITNYDRYGGHLENVPITWLNLANGTYLMEATDTGGSTQKLPLTAENNKVVTNLVMPPNAIKFVRLIPQTVDAASLPTPSPTAIPTATPLPEATSSSTTSAQPPIATPGVFGDIGQ
jgi:xylan 1,4-beta-xylosidase